MSEALDRLRRWEDSGATWRIVVRRPGDVEIALLTCDAGEQVDRIVTADREVLDYVDRAAGED
ncbi:hypothetical protein [Actinoplanes sp. NPDC051411]|jgi:hypothetical protein|uniref:hypothetical protein n=1 Tax=Actinoplanes sp. NPDC051411 TaxID=3155522 RepID=UPI003443F44B